MIPEGSTTKPDPREGTPRVAVLLQIPMKPQYSVQTCSGVRTFTVTIEGEIRSAARTTAVSRLSAIARGGESAGVCARAGRTEAVPPKRRRVSTIADLRTVVYPLDQNALRISNSPQ
jgi:hypothetical protein